MEKISKEGYFAYFMTDRMLQCILICEFTKRYLIYVNSNFFYYVAFKFILNF